MRETGTLHLMAISGLHIALAASIVWFLVRGLQFLLSCHRVNWQMPLLAGLFFAAFYAADRSATARATHGHRTCCTGGAADRFPAMVSMAGVDLLCRGNSDKRSLSHTFAESAFVCIAVAALIFWFQWLPLPHWQWARRIRPLLNSVYLQVGMLLLLMPLQVLIFHGFSISSLIANFFAVPLVTFVCVPLILLGMLLHLLPLEGLESGIWYAADKTLAGLFWLLMRLPDGWQSVDQRWQYMTLLPWLILIGWRFRARKTVPAVCLAGSVLLASPSGGRRKRRWTLHMLDVGQGLAMVIERQGKAILYDTGLAAGRDSAQRLIIPWLRWHHLQPEGVILSHEHLDHAGGLVSLQNMA